MYELEYKIGFRTMPTATIINIYETEQECIDFIDAVKESLIAGISRLVDYNIREI